MNPLSLSLLVLAVSEISNVLAFQTLSSIPLSSSVSKVWKAKATFHSKFSNSKTRKSSSSLYATKEEVESDRKVIAYDGESGENLEKAMCQPEEEYCVVDKESGELLRLTLEEKERIFLDALQSYYFSGRQLLNDAEFDILKEDLAWNGSSVAVLNRKEAKYLAAMEAYLKSEPIISDAEFDELKTELKEEKSQFAVDSEPKCYIDTGVCKVTMQQDNFRTNLLYLPSGLILFTLWLGIGYELVGGKINPVYLGLLGSPFIVNGAKKLTQDYLFQNNEIVYGPCPTCEEENRIYFGDILGVEGYGEVANVKCPKCKKAFNVQRDTLRASSLPKN